MDPNRFAGARALVVDDDDGTLRFHQTVLERLGCDVTACYTAEEALAALERERFDVVLSDMRLPGMSGADLLVEARRSRPDVPVILATGYGTVAEAVEAMRRGAADYVTKPLSAADLETKLGRVLKVQRLEAENRWLHNELQQAYRPGLIVAVSPQMRDIETTIDKVSSSDASVLVTGESGTGKELVARAIHWRSGRAQGPFVPLNCAAIPAGLIESELFGHARGSFTGAVADSPGKMERANRGTLFLDEIGELPLELQPKLLRALELKTIERVGEHRPRRIDFRLIAATNRDLAALVRQGRFREDLYYRLAVVPIHLPPLRERRADIAPLARFLVRKLGGPDAPELGEDALAELTRRSWPGNVRELSNLIERTLALHEGGPIGAGDLPPEPVTAPPRIDAPAPAAPAPALTGQPPVVTLPPEGAALDDMVRDLIVQALERKGWNQSAAARLLRIPRHILQYRMQKFGIQRPGSAAE